MTQETPEIIHLIKIVWAMVLVSLGVLLASNNSKTIKQARETILPVIFKKSKERLDKLFQPFFGIKP